MAGTGVDNYSYILLKDTQGEKAAGRIMSAFGSGPKTIQVLRGELLTLISHRDLQPRNDEKQAHNYRLKKDPNVTVYCVEDDVSPLSWDDLELLEAIQKSYDRFAVFSEDAKLEWGGKLKMGDQVYVKIPSVNSYMPDWSIADVRYVGEVEFLPGKHFGVEIKVSFSACKDCNVNVKLCSTIVSLVLIIICHAWWLVVSNITLYALILLRLHVYPHSFIAGSSLLWAWLERWILPDTPVFYV